MDPHEFVTSPPPMARLYHAQPTEGRHQYQQWHYPAGFGTSPAALFTVPSSSSEVIERSLPGYYNDSQRGCSDAWTERRVSEPALPFSTPMMATGHGMKVYPRESSFMHPTYTHSPPALGDEGGFSVSTMSNLKRHASEGCLTGMDSYRHVPRSWIPSTSPPSSSLSSPSPSSTPSFVDVNKPLLASEAPLITCFSSEPFPQCLPPHVQYGEEELQMQYLVPPPLTSNGKRSHSHRVQAGHTKKPPNAFLRFRTYFIEQNALLPDSHPARLHDSRAISSAAGLVWRGLSNEVKKPWSDEAKWALLDFKRDHPELLSLPTKSRAPKRIRRKRAHTPIDTVAARHAALAILPTLAEGDCEAPVLPLLSTSMPPLHSNPHPLSLSPHTDATNDVTQQTTLLPPLAFPHQPSFQTTSSQPVTSFEKATWSSLPTQSPPGFWTH